MLHRGSQTPPRLLSSNRLRHPMRRPRPLISGYSTRVFIHANLNPFSLDIAQDSGRTRRERPGPSGVSFRLRPIVPSGERAYNPPPGDEHPLPGDDRPLFGLHLPFVHSSARGRTHGHPEPNGHFSAPHGHRAHTAATTRIAAALPRRVPSCAVAPPRFFGFGLHFAASTCAKPTAPTHLGEGTTHDTHAPVTNPADMTIKKWPA